MPTDKPVKKKRGRPSKYDKIDLKQVQILGALGLTAEEIALVLEISKRTFFYYQKRPDFLHAIKTGKLKADMEIISDLRKQARSGNVTAQIFWLKNRQPEKWRDRQEFEHSGGVKTDSALTVKVIQVKDEGKKRNN